MRERELKRVPQFESEDEEREFWSTHDSAEYVDWQAAREVRLARLKPTTRTMRNGSGKNCG